MRRLAKHFLLSAAIAANADTVLADAIGLYKELEDARHGSGFSFSDLAADRAGTRFGEKAVGSAATATRLQQAGADALRDADLMPSWTDLADGMPEGEFRRRFGGVDAPAYVEVVREIDRRVAGLRVLRRRAGEMRREDGMAADRWAAVRARPSATCRGHRSATLVSRGRVGRDGPEMDGERCAPMTGFDARRVPPAGAARRADGARSVGRTASCEGIAMSLQTQFVKFALVGGLATALQYAILVVLVEGPQWPPVFASSVGFAVSALGNYLLNRRFTFRSQRRHLEAAPRFAVVAVIGFWINAAVVWLAFDAAGLHYLVAQVVATLATLGWTFAANRNWTFGHAAPSPPPPDRRP